MKENHGTLRSAAGPNHFGQFLRGTWRQDRQCDGHRGNFGGGLTEDVIHLIEGDIVKAPAGDNESG
jgi:hypothetical protein